MIEQQLLPLSTRFSLSHSESHLSSSIIWSTLNETLAVSLSFCLDFVNRCLLILFISIVGVVSELRVEDLGGDLTDAVANIAEVLSVEASHTLRDATEESCAVWDSQAESARHKLTVLLVVVELSELTSNSVEVREVAVTIIDIFKLVKMLHCYKIAMLGFSASYLWDRLDSEKRVLTHRRVIVALATSGWRWRPS